MNDVRTLASLLNVNPPWGVIKHKLNPQTRRLDLWLGRLPDAVKPPGLMGRWFSSAPAPQPAKAQPTTYTSWRHLNFGEWQTQVHVPSPMPADLQHLECVGEEGQHFTHGFSRIVFAMLNEGAPLGLICSALQVNLTDLWKYKLGLDRGQVGAPNQWDRADAVALQKALAPSTQGEVPVPEIDNPCWQALAQGDLNLDINTLSLRLLLTRVKAQYMVAADDAVRALHLRDLQRFFVKNSKSLRHELRQLAVPLDSALHP